MNGTAHITLTGVSTYVQNSIYVLMNLQFKGQKKNLPQSPAFRENIARMANAVQCHSCQVIKIVMISGSQLSEFESVSQMSQVPGLSLLPLLSFCCENCQNCQ